MTNKTFKEERWDLFKKKYRGWILQDDQECYRSFATIETFIYDSLDLQKQKILEALPKERKPSTYNELPNGAIVSLDTDAQGHNQCLSEVKHIIENI